MPNTPTPSKQAIESPQIGVKRTGFDRVPIDSKKDFSEINLIMNTKRTINSRPGSKSFHFAPLKRHKTDVPNLQPVSSVFNTMKEGHTVSPNLAPLRMQSKD
jgi:hypothetical protein